MHVLVRWAESPTTGSINCGDERLIFYTSNSGTAWGGQSSQAADMVSRDAALLVKFDSIADVDRNVLGRIGVDILRKFQFYAVPCVPGSSPPPNATGGTLAVPTPEDEQEAWNDRDTGMPTDENLGLLGTSDPCRDTHSGYTNSCPDEASSATELRLPAVFPAGTRLQSVRFFAGPAAGVPMNQRAYGMLKADQLEYLYWEIELSYPGTASQTDFRVETVVFRNEQEFYRYRSGQQTIVPGSTQFHHLGHGRDGGGFWQAGRYEFRFYVGGDLLASEPVTID